VFCVATRSTPADLTRFRKESSDKEIQ